VKEQIKSKHRIKNIEMGNKNVEIMEQNMTAKGTRLA
jgi:hypothetical protein